MEILTLPTSSITIPPNRQRKEINPSYIDSLSESIKCIGLINPIIIDDDNTLIAGYCRIKAHEALGRLEIAAIRKSDLDDWDKEVIEFEENVRRQNLEYNDQLLAELKLYEMYQQRYGTKPGLYAHTSTARSKWRIEDMAKLMGFSYGKMSERLSLARAVRDDPKLGQMKSVSQAKHELERRQVTAARTIIAAVKMQEHKEQQAQAQQEDPSIESPSPAFVSFTKDNLTLINADSRDYIPTLADDSVGCLITDPPWNVAFDTTFGGNPDEGFLLTKDVLQLLYPKLQDGSLCIMYCATRHLITGKVYQLVQSCGYAIYDSIHIWYKPSVAMSSQPYRELKYDYEPALVFSKGRGRDFNYPMFAVISDVLVGKRDHPAQKSVHVLSELIKNFSVEHDIVIDPFMGSGSTLLACHVTGRRGLGIERDLDSYSTAVYLMEQ